VSRRIYGRRGGCRQDDKKRSLLLTSQDAFRNVKTFLVDSFWQGEAIAAKEVNSEVEGAIPRLGWLLTVRIPSKGLQNDNVSRSTIVCSLKRRNRCEQYDLNA
jgi:hypothetical protein